jgi:hypothetical protein
LLDVVELLGEDVLNGEIGHRSELHRNWAENCAALICLARMRGADCFENVDGR